MMTGQHFKEIVEIICKTTGRNKYEVAEGLGVHNSALFYWQHKGVPWRKIPKVRKQFKSMLFEKEYTKNTHSKRWSFHG